MAEGRPKLEWLQVFRGIAAILVVLFHVTKELSRRYEFSFLREYFIFGEAGVDFFFVLSGFIIYYVHQQDVAKPAATGNYLRRRLIRVYPTYWLILIPVVIINLVVPSLSSQMERSVSNILLSFLLIPQSHLPVLGVAWTLSHELLFYLMFALLIGLPRRWSIGVVGSWVFCTIVSFVLGITSPGTYTSLVGDRYLLGFFLSPFNIEFLLGAIAAHLLLKRPTNRGPAILAVGISLFVVASLNVSYSWFEFDFSIANRIIFFGVPSFLIVWGAGNTESQWKLAAPKISQLMGDSSYSIYLTHFPVLVAVLIAAKKFGWAPGITGLLAVATCVLFGILVYSTIERPLLQFCRRLLPDPVC